MNAPAPSITVKLVTEAVSRHFGITERELTSYQRNKRVAWPRHVAVGLAARLTPYNLSRIGRALGGRDHSTVIHSQRRFADRLLNDPEAAAQIAAIEQSIVEKADAAAAAVELAFTESEIDERTRELGKLDAAIYVAERRFAAVRQSFEIVRAARAVARARTAVIIAEHTPGQGPARRELDRRVDELMRIAEGGHV